MAAASTLTWSQSDAKSGSPLLISKDCKQWSQPCLWRESLICPWVFFWSPASELACINNLTPEGKAILKSLKKIFFLFFRLLKHKVFLAFCLQLEKKVNLKYTCYAMQEKWWNRPKIYSSFKMNSLCNRVQYSVKGPPPSLKETNLFSVSAEFTLFPTAYTLECLLYGDWRIKRVWTER